MVSKFYIKKYLDKNKELILNGIFKKIQKINKKIYRIQLNKGNIYIKLDEGIEIKKETISGENDNFCMIVRKKLKNSKLIEISQINYDRIIKLSFQKYSENEKIEKYYLIIELFGKGDIFLCDEEYNILKSINNTKKGKYEITSNNEQLMDFENFKNTLKTGFIDNISKTLAKTIGLGGEYANYLCNKLNIDPKKENMENIDLKKLYYEVKELYENPPVDLVEKEFHISMEPIQNKEKKKKLTKEEIKILNLDKNIEKHKEKAKKYLKIAKFLEENIEKVEEIIRLYKNKKINSLKEKGIKIKEGKLFISFES